MVYEDFTKFKTISPRVTDNASDTVLMVLSKMYAFNYKYSYYLLKENNYVAKLFDSLTFDNKEIEDFYKKIFIVLNSYIDKRIGVYNA